MLDKFYLSMLNQFKKNRSKRSLQTAFIYINLLETSIYLFLGIFFKIFLKQLKIVTMSDTKFWTVISLLVAFIIFKNWLRYNGKRRNILRTQVQHLKWSTYLLWLLPIAILSLSLILWQAT